MTKHGRIHLAFAAVLLVLLPGAAGAQLEIRSLPGDPSGEKRPFQYHAYHYLDPPSFWFENMPLPNCTVHLTVETVTAVVTMNHALHAPRLTLHLQQMGDMTQHTIALAPLTSASGYTTYQATHAVRLHHDASRGELPIIHYYGDATGVFEVSVAGYTTHQCRRSIPDIDR